MSDVMTASCQVGGYVAFAGDDNRSDPDEAANVLRRAGFTVVRMKPEDRRRLQYPELGDDFLLVTMDVPIDCDREHIDRLFDIIMDIVDELGGSLVEGVGVMNLSRGAFAELFGDPAARQ